MLILATLMKYSGPQCKLIQEGSELGKKVFSVSDEER